MDNELIMRIANYRAAMSLANEMLENGIISAEEYEKIDTIMAKKYGLSSCCILRAPTAGCAELIGPDAEQNGQ